MMPEPRVSSAKEFYRKRGILTKMPVQRRDLLIGEIVSLMLLSKLHRLYRINDIGSVVLPPIHLNQFRIYRIKGRIVGFVTWAWLSEKIEKNYLTGEYHLKPEDWNSGKRGWIIDFIAPNGHARGIIRDLRNKIFPEETGFAVRVGSNGKLRGVRRLRGARAEFQSD